MPPKRSTKSDDLSEEEIDDFESDEEITDQDYQEDHIQSDKKDDKIKQKDSDDDEKDVESDDERDADVDDIVDFDVMDYPDEEAVGDEIDPPRPELVKNRKVVDPMRRETSDRLSLYECARVLGDRARHIDNKARPNVDTKNCTGSLEIAYMELMQKRIPMAVIRKVGLGQVEIWRVKEMIIPKLPPIEYFMIQIH